MNFRTRIDFTNRQAKQYEKTDISLSGSSIFGLPYSSLTSGPDLSFSGITYEDAALQSTYSGNTGTTVYTFSDSRMTIDEGDLVPLTPSNSGTTQYAGPTWAGYDMFTTLDGYTGWTYYSAVTYDIVVVSMVDLGGGAYSGIVQSDFITYSATSLDYTGRTIWVDVSGITRTQDLIVSNNPVIDYVLTCSDSEGKATWQPSSGTSGSSTVWSAGTGTNSISAKNHGSVATDLYSVSWGSGNTASGRYSTSFGGDTVASGNTATAYGNRTRAYGISTFVGGKAELPYYTIATGVGAFNHSSATAMNSEANANYSAILGGSDFYISSNSVNSIILGGSYNIISGTSTYCGILGGFDHILSGGSKSLILGGDNNRMNSGTSVIAGGSSNQIVNGTGDTSGSFIAGGSNGLITDDGAIIIGGLNNKIIGSNDSAIICGTANSISGGSTNIIISSSGSTIYSGVSNSVIIGGVGFTGSVSNMVYVPDLTIDGLTSTDPIATDSTGKLVAGASDIRLKENIKDLTSALEKVLKLRGVSYEWTEESNMGAGVTKFGLIAQEVQEIIPEMVRARSKGDGMLSLSYTEIVPWLIEAIKELATKSAETKYNSIIETQIIASEDNNIELNYNGNHDSAVGGGITVLNAVSNGVNSEIKTDKNGKWIITPALSTTQLSLPEYTPKSTEDKIGDSGDVVWDDNYLYIKTNGGWKRSSLENF